LKIDLDDDDDFKLSSSRRRRLDVSVRRAETTSRDESTRVDTTRDDTRRATRGEREGRHRPIDRTEEGEEERLGRMSEKKSSLSSSARRIQKELAEISLEPPTNCSAGPKGDNLYEWVSTIVGPTGA
tara:strand:- start:339 stop:719 length:381 start_codon:yes stop_codon:yes gene_type:complete